MKSIAELLGMLHDPRKDTLLGVYNHTKEQMHAWPASVKHHHHWPGGYHDHVTEVMNLCHGLALEMYDILPVTHPDGHDITTFVDRAIIAGFVHDFDKLVRYKVNKDHKGGIADKGYFGYRDHPDYMTEAKVVTMLAKYDVFLDDQELNALTFQAGGWANMNGRLTHLASVLHAADMMSTNVTGHQPPKTEVLEERIETAHKLGIV